MSQPINFENTVTKLEETWQMINKTVTDVDTVEVFESAPWNIIVVVSMRSRQIYQITRAKDEENYRRVHKSFFAESDGCMCHKCKHFKPDGTTPFDRCGAVPGCPCAPEHNGIVTGCLLFELETEVPPEAIRIQNP